MKEKARWEEVKRREIEKRERCGQCLPASPLAEVEGGVA